MAHAHPTIDGHFSQPTSRPNHLFRPSPPADPIIIRNPSFQPPQERLNPNSRRLQLRNAGFRGSLLPTRRNSPFGSSPAASELSSRHANEENSPRMAEKRAIYGENLPSSPISILQELSNSSRQKRTPRPNLSGIFEDADTKENKPPDLPGSSWLNEPGVGSSPAARPRTPLKVTTTQTIAPQEKEQNPTLHKSPAQKQIKGRRKARSNHRSTSFDASRYIEHLESELAALNTRVDALTCPAVTRAQGAKVRALTNQVRSLRLEVSGWENKFEERVSDEVAKRSEAEADLKRALRRLEHENEAKDIRIQELEVEIEHAQIKVKEADSLAITNQDLERRVDTLTQLLAQSPTRQEHQHPLPSPDKLTFAHRTPRPRSMLLRIPSSPVLPHRLSLHMPTAASWRSSSFQSTHSIPETPEEGTPPKAATDEADEPTPQPNYQSRPASESLSLGSNFHDSLAISSRPTSITSSTSSAGIPWSSSYSCQANEDPRLASRARRMRRFPSGTGSLKPLILPNSVGGPSLPSSAPFSRTSFASGQDFSDTYFDRTSGFLSIAEIADMGSPVITPSQPLRQRSTSWARRQALNALEGKPYSRGDEEDTQNHCDDLSPYASASPEAVHNTSTCANSEETPPRQRLSLEFELSGLETALNTPEVEPEKPRAAGLEPNAPSPLANQAQNMSPENLSSSAPRCFTTQRMICRHPSLSPHPIVPLTRCHSEPPYQITNGHRRHASAPKTQIRSQSSTPHTAESPGTVALFSRLTNLITSMHDPMILARRILHTAWTRTSTPKAHGGLGWWLMGLVYRSCHGSRKSDLIPEKKTEELDDDRFSAGRRDSNIDWHQFYSAEASKHRRVMAFAGDGVFARKAGDRASDSELSSQVRSSNHEDLQGSRPGGTTDVQQPVRCKDCVEPAGRRPLRLWLRFSLAVVLAIGVAIKDGPGALMGDDEVESDEAKKTSNENVNARSHEGVPTCSTEGDSIYPAKSDAPNESFAGCSPTGAAEQGAVHEATNVTEDASIKKDDDDDDEEYWGWELTFRNYTAEDIGDGKELADSSVH